MITGSWFDYKFGRLTQDWELSPEFTKKRDKLTFNKIKNKQIKRYNDYLLQERKKK